MNNTDPPSDLRLWHSLPPYLQNTLLWKYLLLRELHRMGLEVNYQKSEVVLRSIPTKKQEPGNI